jgi:hypothetical protein
MMSVLAVPRSMAISCVKKLNNPMSERYYFQKRNVGEVRRYYLQIENNMLVLQINCEADANSFVFLRFITKGVYT